MDFLDTHNLLPKTAPSAHVFIGTPTEADIAPAQALATTLRDQGLSVLVHVSGKGLGDQVKEAVKRGIPFFFAYGENEAKTGNLKLKELATSTEDVVSEDELVSVITR